MTDFIEREAPVKPTLVFKSPDRVQHARNTMALIKATQRARAAAVAKALAPPPPLPWQRPGHWSHLAIRLVGVFALALLVGAIFRGLVRTLGGA